MPRRKRTQSGQTARPLAPVEGQAYGASQEQMALERQLPTPTNTVPALPSPGSAGVAAAPSPGGVVAPPMDDPAARYAGALAEAGPIGGDVLAQPTTFPAEPVTTGLTRGPGAGPGVLRRPARNAVGERLRRLSLDTGDPYWAELAARARI